MDDLFPIIIAGFVAALAWGAWSLYAHLSEADKRKLSARLAGTSGSIGNPETAASSIVFQPEAPGLPGPLGKLAAMRKLNAHLLRAWPDASIAKFLGVSIALALTAAVVMLLMTNSMMIAIFAGAGAGYIPFALASNKRSRRQKLLALQLPEGLDFLQRILKAGHSLSTGMAMMGEELPQPLAAEFRKCYDQHSLGQPLEDALKEMAQRIESTDFAFFVTAVLIQRQTGGDLSAVLGNISGMIRQRIRLQQYVKAKTAEGRFTGYILVAFPVLMFFVASSMNADYKKNLLDDPTGQMLLGIAGGLVFAGLISIRKITTVRV